MITLTEFEIEQLWGNGITRVFLSHVESGKQDAALLKETLDMFGFATFLSFESVAPMEYWSQKIERALLSMNILLALVTQGFNESEWANQEMGVAFGRNVPIVTIKKGGPPKGLMAQFQAIDANQKSGEEMAIEFVNTLFQIKATNSVATDAFIESVSNISSMTESNRISSLAKNIQNLTEIQRTRLVDSFNVNPKAQRSPRLRREILHKLNELTGDTYWLQSSGSSNRWQILPKPLDALVVGRTGEACTHSGEYRPICHVEVSQTTNEGEIFRQCSNELPEPHDAIWVLVKPAET